jgi:hypothetical protein
MTGKSKEGSKPTDVFVQESRFLRIAEVSRESVRNESAGGNGRPGFKSEIGREIAPGRIVVPDEVIFLAAYPALDLFLASDGVADVSENFVVDESKGFVTGRESLSGMTVVVNTASQIVCNARIEGAAAGAGEHIDVVAPLLSHGFILR